MKTKKSNSNIEVYSSFANLKNAKSVNNVTQELAEREHQLEDKANSTGSTRRQS